MVNSRQPPEAIFGDKMFVFDVFSMSFSRKQDDGGGRGRHREPVTQKGCEALQEETPKTPVCLSEEDPEEERAGHNFSQAQAKHRPVRAGQQVKIDENSKLFLSGWPVTRDQEFLSYSNVFDTFSLVPHATNEEYAPQQHVVQW